MCENSLFCVCAPEQNLLLSLGAVCAGPDVKTPFGPVKSFFAFMSINLAIAVCGSLVVVFWGVRHTEPLSPFSTHSHSHPHSRILSECLRQCARWC